MSNINTGITFDRGIEQIISQYEATPEQIDNKRNDYQPVGQQVYQHVNELLSAQTLTKKIQDFIQPHLVDQDVLIPEQYNRLLNGLTDKLNTQEFINNPELKKMKDLLNDEAELQLLLSSYRNLLIQG